jgi:uncharacterized protein YaiL (DUF2058 family)
MSDSLRDQLLGLGFKPAPKPDPRKPDPRKLGPKPGKAGQVPGHAQGRPGRGPRANQAARAPKPPRARQEMDLGKAFALRALQEKQERIEAERLKQEQARLRREARARLAELLQGKALNDPAADIARHFEYGGKIKRVHVTADQLKALNAGALGVVQLDGRYLLVDAASLAIAQDVFPAAVALQVDPSAPVADDPYADPRYQVPDDLVW